MNYNGLTPEEVLAIATKKISGLKSIVSYKGVTTTALTDGSTTNPIIIEGSSYIATNGDCVLYEGVYYTWNGTSWQESLSFAEVITALEDLNDRVDGILDGTSIDSFKDTEDALDDKVDKVVGKCLSSNDYTNDDKAIVDSVTGALAEKQDVLTFDDEPTANSNNPVKSGGVFDTVNTSPKTITGNTVTFSDGIDLPARNVTVTIEPSQEGTGDPSPTNVRPLIGFDEVDVEVCGKNLVNKSAMTAGWYSETARVGQVATIPDRTLAYAKHVLIRVKPLSKYILTFASSTTTFRCAYTMLDRNMVVLATDYHSATVSGWTYNLSTPENAYYISVETPDQNKLNDINIQLEESTTATEYEPYNGKTITVQLGRTVYGGVLDVTNGKLTLTYKGVDLGSLNWTYTGRLFYSGDLASIVKPNTDNVAANMLCTKYKTLSFIDGLKTDKNISIGLSVNFNYLNVLDSDYTDAATFKAAASGALLAYELKTPEVIDLTPTEIDMLLGYNTISTNGTTLSLVYQPNNVLGVAEKYTDDKVKELSDSIDSIDEALAEKADTDDIPDLVSDNLAKGILGNETVLSTDTVPFVSKTMGAGKYQRKKFVGCSYVWNQIVENGDFASDTGWTVTNGTLSIANNVATITAVNNGAVQFYRAINQKTTGHVVLVSFDCECSQNISLSVNWGDILKTVSISPTKQRITFVATIGSGNNYFNFYATNMTANETVKYSNVILTDLTQLFGSTAIADAIYNLEQATSGAGIAKLKELGFFTEDYYAYDAGSVQSVDIKEYSVTGKNLFNKNTAFVGYKLVNNGNIQTNQSFTASDYIGVIPGSQLYLSNVSGNQVADTCAEYDSQKRFIKNVSVSGSVKASGKITVSSNTYYIRVNMNIANSDICQVELNSTATDYEPYHKTTYPLTPTELRGMASLDANNNIYCDGDEYASDGEVTRNWYIPTKIKDISWSRKTLGGNYVFRSDSPWYTGDSDGLCSNVFSRSYSGNHGINFGSRYWDSNARIAIRADECETVEDFIGTYGEIELLWKRSATDTETLTPFDYPQSVGSIEEIVDYKVEQEDRDVAIPTGHVTEYMGKGGEFTLPTLPETPSVLAYDGHNFFWKPETA